MKLKDYAAAISKLAKKHPDFEVIYSCDDEGNGFSPVSCGPTIGRFEDNEFTCEDDSEPNAVCVN